MDKGSVKKINEHVRLIRDDHGCTCYLVIGNEKAMLVDTMNGYLDLWAIIRAETDLPVIVVNTHGHIDHVFGNFQFDEAYMHPADLTLVDHFIERATATGEMPFPGLPMSKFLPVRNGDTFDLGSLTVEVIELPGHTAGGICLLVKEDRMLITGDSINRHLWLQLGGCLTVKEYIAKLDSIDYVKQQADWILHGHAIDKDPISLFDDLRCGLIDLVNGNTEDDSDYKWFGGICRQHPFAENSVIVYQPDNIQ